MSAAPPPAGRLAGRLALITGATRGIGAAVARRYAREGARLILVARTVGALEEIDDAVRSEGAEAATLVPLNLRDGTAIDRLGGSLYERFGHLDILVGNAGMLGPISPLAHVAPKDWEQVMTINLTANWRLIRSLDPLLRASEAGRAIFVTSGAVARPRAYWGPYAVSKAGLETLVQTYAAELVKTNARANLIDPGKVRTAMRAAAYPGEDPMTLPAPEDVTEPFVELAETGCARNGETLRAY